MASNTEDVELRELVNFLHGSGELEGHWFGDKVPGRPMYWWRPKLLEAMNNYEASIQQEANRQKAELLDRLSSQWGETIDHTLGNPIRIKFVAIEVIEAERKQLEKEVNYDRFSIQ